MRWRFPPSAFGLGSFFLVVWSEVGWGGVYYGTGVMTGGEGERVWNYDGKTEPFPSLLLHKDWMCWIASIRILNYQGKHDTIVNG
jgi:hypothetical protein